MAATRRELERIGDHPTVRDDGRFSWRDIVPVPAEAGMQHQRQFSGRTASIIDAAVRVEHTYDILNGPLPELIEKLRIARDALEGALSFAAQNGPNIAAAIHNGDFTRKQRVAFGAEPQRVKRFDQRSANRTMAACKEVGELISETLVGLEARMPDAVTAGLYALGSSGPVRHFAMVLKEGDRTPNEIAEYLGHLSARENFTHESSWKTHLRSAIGRTKKLANRAKHQVSRAVISGTTNASKRVPPRAIECVIVQVNAGSNQHFTGYVAGSAKPTEEAEAISGAKRRSGETQRSVVRQPKPKRPPQLRVDAGSSRAELGASGQPARRSR